VAANAAALLVSALALGAAVAVAVALLGRLRGKAAPGDDLRIHLTCAATALALFFAFGTIRALELDGQPLWAVLASLAALAAGLVAYRLIPLLASLHAVRRVSLGLVALGSAMLVAGTAVAAIGLQGSPPPAVAVEDEDEADLASTMRFPPVDPPLSRDPEGRGKLVVIGMDGLDWKLLAPLIEAGEAPHFARIVREGTRAVLDTQVPTASPRIWTTVVTGREPDDHGIVNFDVVQYPSLGIHRLYRSRALNYTSPFLDLLGHGWHKPISSHERRTKAIWNLAQEAGIRIGVVGWWASWPAEATNGFVVSDHAYYEAIEEKRASRRLTTAAAGGQTYPPELIESLSRFHTPIEATTPEDFAPFARLTADDVAHLGELLSSRSPDKRAQAVRTLALAIQKDRFYGESALDLDVRFDPEVLLVYFNAVDSFGHAVYDLSVPDALDLGYSPEEVKRFSDSMNAAVRSMDAWLGRFLARSDRDTTIVVLSDHGFERQEPDAKRGHHGHDHAPPGILVAFGRNVRRGHDLGRAHIDDVAPTLFHLAGIPLSEELDGELLTELLEPQFLAAHPPLTVPSYESGPPRIVRGTGASSQDDQMLGNLRALGYIE